MKVEIIIMVCKKFCKLKKLKKVNECQLIFVQKIDSKVMFKTNIEFKLYTEKNLNVCNICITNLKILIVIDY